MTDQTLIGPTSASAVDAHKRGLRAHYALCSSLKTRNRFARRPSSRPWLFLGFASFQPLPSTKTSPNAVPSLHDTTAEQYRSDVASSLSAPFCPRITPQKIMRSTSWPLSILGAFASLAVASVDIDWSSDGTLRGQEILSHLPFCMITHSEGAWWEVETSFVHQPRPHAWSLTFGHMRHPCYSTFLGRLSLRWIPLSRHRLTHCIAHC